MQDSGYPFFVIALSPDFMRVNERPYFAKVPEWIAQPQMIDRLFLLK